MTVVKIRQNVNAEAAGGELRQSLILLARPTQLRANVTVHFIEASPKRRHLSKWGVN